jgi:PAS domain S-box-containing protein
MIQGAIYDNTQQIKSDEQIRKSEEHYRFLFETMAEGAVFQDRNGTIIDANLSAERILGLTHDQILGRASRDPEWKSIREDFSPYPGDEHPSMVALRTGEKTSGIMGVANPRDNQYRWILINSVPIFQNGEKKPCQVFTTFEDITREQVIKQALLVSERQYRELVESISDTPFTLNREGECTYVSPAVKKNFGFDPAEIIGHDYREWSHPGDREKIESWFRLTLQNQGQPVEFRGYNSEQEIRHIRIMASPVFEGDAVVGISGIISDITAWIEGERVKTQYNMEIQALLNLHLLTRGEEEEIFSYTLRAALDITESYTGFIVFPSREIGNPDYHTCSESELKTGKHPPESLGISGSEIWSECRSSKKAVIRSNLMQKPGDTGGDRPCSHLLAVPILEGDNVVAALAVARNEPYSENNVNSLRALGNTLWDIIRKNRSEDEIKSALSQIAKNMEQLATLNDTIRNPLAIIAATSDLIDPALRDKQIEAVRNIDSMIMMLDKGWIQSEKVRNFLLKHYHISKSELDSENSCDIPIGRNNSGPDGMGF